ncbi:polysaccharide biosynthesis/export family protein [Alteromonas sp. ASW11-36]|uniref:Polysaccharide biosynthesis/export family protein n=1 Tax=Alteromonas arenosi TaxID=3055817 RepID=A0ABT7SSZ2_9ALTE|nr:polysaccharide biosynthesis/export family protein [Alteromonas sp. ASW11-36]MDM7859316.1 polysaccharide biosynthesis/export family protein [Alteromonas sp. ASW11-36]
MKSYKTLLVLLSLANLLSACTQHHGLRTAEQSEHDFYGEMNKQGVAFAQRTPEGGSFFWSSHCDERFLFAAPVSIVSNEAGLVKHSPSAKQNSSPFSGQLTLSQGDLIELQLDMGEGFAGNYMVDSLGNINVPMLPPIQAIGKTTSEISKEIELALIKAQLFQPETAMTTIKVLRWSAIEVTVEGAVFASGRVLINTESPDAMYDARDAATGDYTPTRYLSEALRAASGVRPDAKLEQVFLVRNGWRIEVDLSGIISGKPVTDIPLVAGDHIVVPSTGCFQPHLVKPSQITPKGFRVFMSNLIDSAESNANAAVGRYSTNLPYGTRLLQGAISANCVGGMSWTNAPRKVVLASKHPITGETQVIERSIEQLLREPDRDAINPYLMPNDAIACYDSDVTNLRDIAATIADVLLPIKLF